MDEQDSDSVTISPEVAYALWLLRTELAFLQITGNIFALLDEDHNSQRALSKKYVILQRVYNQELEEEDYICSCKKGECLHIKAISTLITSDNISDSYHLDSFEYEYLTRQLIGIYCKEDNTYSILSKTARELKCLKCPKNVRSCVHVNAFNIYKSENEDENDGEDTQVNVRDQDIYRSISEEKIPYPFEAIDDIEKFTSYVSGHLKHPTILIPEYFENKTCAHGSYFSRTAEPLNKQSWIHFPHFSLECTVYFRRAYGCVHDCRQYYDGRSDLILNLNNKHLYSYTWLIDILHNTQETRFPLHAAYRSAKRTRSVCGIKHRLKRSDYNNMRKAYNCFLRLLEIDFQGLYQCPKCSNDVDTIIMDGIMMGCRKDLMPTFKQPQIPDIQIKECSISERIFIRSAKTRMLLSKWAGRVKGKYTNKIDKLAWSDYEQLLNGLSNNLSLQAVVEEAGNPCPLSVQKIAGELSRDSPTCGILQIAGNDENTEEIRHILKIYTSGPIARSHTLIHNNRVFLDKTCPLLVDFLFSLDIHTQAKMNLVKDLLHSVDGPFTGRTLNDQHFYGEISDINTMFDFFPNNLPIRGKANYEADKPNEKLSTGCRKLTHTHPTLTPGFFTILCKHGVCIGFQFMESPESPRTAFELLVRRFEKMPKYVIYDNACKLHLMALKREPILFQNTKFLVDRLHYRQGHTGCSLGYCMDSYSADKDIKSINSQANEQANRKLRLLSTQAIYMPPENVILHVKVFLSIRNMDKILDVARAMQEEYQRHPAY